MFSTTRIRLNYTLTGCEYPLKVNKYNVKNIISSLNHNFSGFSGKLGKGAQRLFFLSRPERPENVRLSKSFGRDSIGCHCYGHIQFLV